MLLRAVSICCGDERPCTSSCRSQRFLAIQFTSACSAFCGRSRGHSAPVPHWSLWTPEKKASSIWLWSVSTVYFTVCENKPGAGKLVLCYESPPFVLHFQLLDNTPKATICQGCCPLSSWEADPDLSVWWERQWLHENPCETVTCEE